MGECRLQQVGSVLAQEHGVAHVRVWYLRRVEQRNGNLVRLDQLEHACKEHALQFEATLVIGVREHEENVLHNAEEVLLEEGI